MQTTQGGEGAIQGGAVVFAGSRVELLNKGETIFGWAPSLREWLKDHDYMFWLGAGGLRIGSPK